MLRSLCPRVRGGADSYARLVPVRPQCHACESRHPEMPALGWIPAFAGMTTGGATSGRRCIRLRNVSSIIMIKAFRYRLYPTNRQSHILGEHLEACRRLYNCLLCDRVQSWQGRGKSIGMYEQQKKLPFLKTDWPPLASVYSQVLQDVNMRVDLAFQAFFRRCKAGDTPGFPRYKGEGRYDSITYPQNTGFALGDTRLRLGKIGRVKARVSRPLEGTPKTCTVRRMATGKMLSERVHNCLCCGMVLDRDENAARNILRLGLQSQAA